MNDATDDEVERKEWHGSCYLFGAELAALHDVKLRASLRERDMLMSNEENNLARKYPIGAKVKIKSTTQAEQGLRGVACPRECLGQEGSVVGHYFRCELQPHHRTTFVPQVDVLFAGKIQLSYSWFVPANDDCIEVISLVQ